MRHCCAILAGRPRREKSRLVETPCFWGGGSGCGCCAFDEVPPGAGLRETGKWDGPSFFVESLSGDEEGDCREADDREDSAEEKGKAGGREPDLGHGDI